MSSQTVSVDRNFDDSALSGLTNGDDITIDQFATLTIDSDMRWGQNAAVVGNIVLSANGAPQLLLDGSKVWWVPFDASSGNVPALGTCGTPDVTRDGSNVGEFLGVFTALGVAPSAAGGAMPASGFIKFRSVSTTFADNDVLTFTGGATATLSGAGQRGWIHIVGEEAHTISTGNAGRFTATGEWFELGETNGADDQTFQYPVIDDCPCIYIEDGSGGYDIYLNAGPRWGSATPTVATDERGRFFGMDRSTGVITIARRASNSCGFKPPSGRKVYIPNIIISSSTSANWALNTVNATVATRWDVTTTGGGVISLTKVIGTWCNAYLYATSVSLSYCGYIDYLEFNSCIGAVTVVGLGIGSQSTPTNSTPVLYCPYNIGVSISHSAIMRYQTTAANQYVMRFNTCENLTLEDVIVTVFQDTASDSHAYTTSLPFGLIECKNVTMTDCVSVGGPFVLSTSSYVTMTNTQYADVARGVTNSTNPYSGAVMLQISANHVTIDGFSAFAGIADVNPYSTLFYLLSVQDITIKNIGTPTVEYDCGSANSTAYLIYGVNAVRCTFRRIYLKNIRTTLYVMQSGTRDWLVENVWGDAGDTLGAMGGWDNTVLKGGRYTDYTGGTSGVSGYHWNDAWTSTTTGRLCVRGNAPTAATAGQASATGTATFAGVSSVYFPAVNDSVTWTMPYFMLGVTSFANTTPTVQGTNNNYCTNEFQYDLGDGWNGTWLALSGTNLSAVGGGVIDPNTGVKLKVRSTRTNATAGTVYINHLRIDTVTDATSQQIQYPVPEDATGAVSNVVVNSRIQIYNVTTDAEIANVEVNAPSYTYTYTDGVGVSAGDVIRVRLTYTSGATAKEPFEALTVATSSGWSVYANQQPNAVYNTWAIDGSAVTGFTADGPNIDIDVAEGSYTKKQLGAWWSYYITTEAGIRNFWGAYTFVSASEIRQEVAVLDVKLQNTDAGTAVIFTDNDVRYYRSDYSLPYDTTAGSGSVYMDYNGVPLVAYGSGTLSEAQATSLANAERYSKHAMNNAAAR